MHFPRNHFHKGISRKYFHKIILTQVGNIFTATRKCETMKMITFKEVHFFDGATSKMGTFRKVTFPMIRNDEKSTFSKVLIFDGSGPPENALFETVLFSMVRPQKKYVLPNGSEF